MKESDSELHLYLKLITINHLVIQDKFDSTELEGLFSALGQITQKTSSSHDAGTGVPN